VNTLANATSAAPVTSIDRVILIILDSVGVGDAPDAAAYGDVGASTLPNLARRVGDLKLPHLAQLGLGNITPIEGVPAAGSPRGAYGRLTELSSGKDTTTGHWELAGIHLAEPFPTFPHGFPPEILEPFMEQAGRGVLGNKPASGTVILDELAGEHLATGKLIVYTSGDSVFQIAAHEELVPVDELYRFCEIARRLLDPHRVGRVIARPFLGSPEDGFHRTARRRDFSLVPKEPTVLQRVQEQGLPVLGVGKIYDIFAGLGISEKFPSGTNDEGVSQTLAAMNRIDQGLIMTNLVDFDSLYGHRRDPVGYARCLEAFDRRLPELLDAVRPAGDLLLLTADHGNDPTMPGSDHTRERVPLLAFGPRGAAGVDLGTSTTYANVAATVAHALGAEPPTLGESFLERIGSSCLH
jgi:phosphopentomutase